MRVLFVGPLQRWDALAARLPEAAEGRRVLDLPALFAVLPGAAADVVVLDEAVWRERAATARALGDAFPRVAVVALASRGSGPEAAGFHGWYDPQADAPRPLAEVLDAARARVRTRLEAPPAGGEGEVEWLRAFFELAPVGAVSLGADGRFSRVNRAFCGMLGYEPEEMRQLTVADVTHPEDLPESLARMVELLAGERDHYRVEKRYLHKSGREVWAGFSCFAQRDEGGGVTSYVALVEDLTPRRRLQERMQQMQRLEALGHMAGSVAHDFYNLLSSISLSVESLMESRAPAEEVRERAGEVLEVVERATAVTDQLVAFSRNRPLRHQRVDLHAVIHDAAPLLVRLLGASRRLDLELGAEPAWIWADRAQLSQVLLNLAVNARDAMPEGGCFTLATAQIAPEEARSLGLVPRPHLLLRVRDTGVGIAPEHLPHIFEPFYTTRETGTGLGLSTVQRVVAGIGGHVRVETVPGAGTEFRLYLPALQSSDGGVLPE